MRKTLCICAAIVSLAAFRADRLPAADPLAEWNAFARSPGSQRLMAWMRCLMKQELTGARCALGAPDGFPPFFGRNGIFVSLMKGKKVRGCYGAFYHKSDDLHLVLREYLSGALRCDPRHAPLDESECDDIDIVITITGARFPVTDPETIDISRQGLLISLDDGGQLVFVPAEFRSIDYLKTRIPRRGVAQITGFRAVSLRE